MRGKLYQVLNPRQDKGTALPTKSETVSLGEKNPTRQQKPTIDIKLKGGEEASVFEKEGKYSFADLCAERRKAWGAIILKDSRKLPPSLSHECSDGLV